MSRPVVRTLHLSGDDHDLFVACTSPAGRARRAVVVCPPFGYEHVCAQRTIRVMSERLAELGHVTVQFDPAGRRNSGRRNVGADETTAWIASAVMAVQYAATLADEVVLVGMRMGSLIAAAAAEQVGAEALVLFDPAPNGRRHLRELRSLQLMGVAGSELADDPGGVNLLGESLSSATVAAIERIDLGRTTPPAHTLMVARPGHAGSERLATAWRETGADVDVVEDAALGDVYVLGAERAVVPVDAVARVVDFVERVSGAAVHPPAGRPVEVASIEPVTGVVEQVVAVGDPVLRGVWCAPADGVPGARAVLFVNNGAHAEPGPANAWVDWGRQLAAQGIASLRVSVRGAGHSDDDDRADAGPRPVDAFYRPSFGVDGRVAAAELRRRASSDVVVAGLCGSSVSGMDLAVSTPFVVGVLAISPPLAFVPLVPRRPTATAAAFRPLVRWFDTSELGEKVGRHLPDRVWGALAAVHLLPTPASAPLRVAGLGVPIVVLGPPEELQVWLPKARRAMRRLLRHPLARVLVGDDFDHAMFRDRGRDAAGAVLAALVTDGLAGVDRVVADASVAGQASSSRSASSAGDQAIASLRAVAS